MIIYFSDRNFNILGHASTSLPDGHTIEDDLKTEDVETGVSSLELVLSFDEKTREDIESYTETGNFLLRSKDGENDFFTIIDREIDTKEQEVRVYAEDAGLDLLNEIAPTYEASELQTIDHYINKFVYDSGFEIGVNEVEDLLRKLSFTEEETVTARLASIASQFDGCEISFSFETQGLKVTRKLINVYLERGKNDGVQLRLNRDIDGIRKTESISNLATALKCEGAIPSGKEKPITLSGYDYDDGDFYVAYGVLYSREALERWTRYHGDDETLSGQRGHITRTFSYDTTSQETLCKKAIAELKKRREVEVNFEADIKHLPDNVQVGDRVSIVDEKGELFVSTRLLALEYSETQQEHKATFGEFRIKCSGISKKVEELAERFAETAGARAEAIAAQLAAQQAQADAELAIANSATATSTADQAIVNAEEAQETAAQAIEAAQQAIKDAEQAAEEAAKAQETADDATEAADNAAKVATNFLGFDPSYGLIVGNNVGGSWSGYRAQVLPSAFNILNASGKVLASYGASLIELGKNDRLAKIDLCDGAAKLYNETDMADEYSRLIIESEHSIKLATNGAIYHNVYKRDENGHDAAAAIHLSTHTPWSGTTLEQWKNNPFPDLDIYTECNAGTLYSKNQLFMSQGTVSLKAYAQCDYASTWVPNAFEHTAAINLSGEAGTLVLRATNGITLNNITTCKNHLYVDNSRHIKSKTSDGSDYTMLHTNSSDRIVVGYGSYELSKEYTAVYGNSVRFVTRNGIYFDGVKFDWVSRTVTAKTGVTLPTKYVGTHEVLGLGMIRLAVNYTPTAEVSSGAAIEIASIPSANAPGYLHALSVYAASTNARRWMAYINNDGVISVRTNSALTAGTEYTFYITGVYKFAT